MVPSTSWGTNWSTGVGRSGSKWAANFIAAGDSVFQKGSQSGPQWQAGVASPTALIKFQNGLRGVTMASVTPTVNGAGMSKYTAAATTKNSKYNNFANVAGQIFSSGLSTLPARGPRGSGQNQARMNAWSQYLISKAGTF